MINKTDQSTADSPKTSLKAMPKENRGENPNKTTGQP